MFRWLVGGLLLAVAAEIWVTQTQGESYSARADLRDALAHVDAIRKAEETCHAANGRYLSLSELARDSCGDGANIIERAQRDGYRLTLDAGVGDYSVKIMPTSAGKLISLYSDQEGRTRIGTRDRPATQESTLLRQSH